jgi:hypothetical protein
MSFFLPNSNSFAQVACQVIFKTVTFIIIIESCNLQPFISTYHTWSYDIEPHLWEGVLDTTLCDKVCQW